MFRKKEDCRGNDGKKWRLSAPFLYRIELFTHAGGGDTARFLDGIIWKGILGNISQHANQVFFEGKESLLHPDIDLLCRILDEARCRYHIATELIQDEPSVTIRKLQQLKMLDRVRVIFPGGLSHDSSRREKGLRCAIDAGLNLWAVMPADALRGLRSFLEGNLLKGIRGISISPGTGSALSAEDLTEAISLSEDGFPVYVESCLPVETLPRSGGGCCRSEGFCSIDGLGNVTVCPHDRNILGNITVKPIEELWRLPDLPDDRVETGTKVGTDEESRLKWAPQLVNLDGNLVPFPRFVMREEPFGAVLIRDYEFVKISPRARMIISSFDGRRTLAEIGEEWGEEALSLVFGLFSRNMVRLGRKKGDDGD